MITERNMYVAGGLFQLRKSQIVFTLSYGKEKRNEIKKLKAESYACRTGTCSAKFIIKIHNKN